MSGKATSSSLRFLDGGGAMGALMRAHDWSRTSLGPPDSWPQPLRLALRMLLNSGHPMYIWWGPDLICFYNDAYRPSIGTDRHPGSLGRPGREVWAEIWPIIGPQIDRVMAGHGATWNENQLVPISRHGRFDEVYWTYSYNPIEDKAAAGGVGGVLVICTETTEQVLAEKNMRAAEARWRELFDQAPGFMCVLRGPEHCFEYYNTRYAEIIGEREILGRSVLEALPEVEAQGFIGLLDEVYRTGQAHVANAAPIHLPRPGDSHALQLRYLDFVYQPIRNAEGEVTGIFVEGADVTERVLATQALAESEARFRTLADNIAPLCWMADETGHVFWYNSRWYEYTGTRAEDMFGWGWQSVHDPSVLPEVMERWRASIATGARFEMTFPIRSASGGYRDFLTRVAPLRDAAGKIIRWFGTNTDISQQLAAEAALRTADRRKDEFLATLAHELRNPLAPVRNAAKVLRLPGADTKTRELATTIIDRQIQTMAGLLDDLLDVSKITQGQIALHRQRTSVASIIETSLEVARPLIDVRGHQLTVSLPLAPIEVDVDPLRLSQVFSNLLTNAAKYTEPGGRIELIAQAEHAGVSITVRDTGVGLEPDSIAQIFEIFSQVKSTLHHAAGGLGIGLALVKGLVELHGGRVSAASAGLGCGSEFCVWLPSRATGAGAPERSQPASGTSPIQKRRILVVDDNEDAAQSLGFLLELAGHELHLAYDGEQAVAMARELRPEIAFVDIGLPKLNGYGVAQSIRAEPWGRRMALIALTGWGQDEDKRRALAAGFDFHLTKPVDPDQVDALIAQSVTRLK
jgi:PAS domain S-box-containing protein